MRTYSHLSGGRTAPCPPLLGPALVPDEAAEGALGNGLHAVDRFEVEDALLDIGRQQQEVEELGHAGPSEAELAGELGAVAVVAAVDGGLKPVGEGGRHLHAHVLRLTGQHLGH